jgi:hypothetical protein
MVIQQGNGMQDITIAVAIAHSSILTIFDPGLRSVARSDRLLIVFFKNNERDRG